MNIKKLIGTSMIALLVVALSVSMAAADTGFTATSQYIDLPDNSQLLEAFSVKWASDAGESTTASWDIYKEDSSGNWAIVTDELSIRNTTATGGSYITGGSIPFADGDSFIFDLKDTGGSLSCNGDKYAIQFTDGTNMCWYSVTVWVSLVPEFATIAIPVVALLGLVLFMRRKKD